MFLSKLLSALFVLIAGSAYALPTHFPVSYIIECKDSKNPAHLMPLTFYEFKEEYDYTKLPDNLVGQFTKAAPKAFSKLQGQLDAYKRKVGVDFGYPLPYDYDTVLNPPADCTVRMIARPDYMDRNVIGYQQGLWESLPKKVQNFILVELAVQVFLSKELEPIDYRRFVYYVSSGLFDKFNFQEKSFFLKHHGINEIVYQGIALDQSREMKFYDSGAPKDAFAVDGATFEGAKIDPKRFVSFFETGELQAIATTTPFKRKVKGQEFSLYIPADALAPYPYDDRYAPRTEFYQNGQLRSSMTTPFSNLYNLVTDIKGGIFDSVNPFTVYFYESGAILNAYHNIPGTLKIGKTVYKVVGSSWWESGKLKEASFTRRENILIKGVMTDALGVTCDETGTPEFAL